MSKLEMAEDIVKRAIEDLNQLLEEDQQLEFSNDLQLMGNDCKIDSMDRADLIVYIETDLEEKLGRDVELLDDRRFSSNDEQNPFWSVEKLIAYIAELLGE